MRGILFASLSVFSTIALAESYESQALRALVNDQEFTKYVAQSEAQRNVKLVGVRATNDAKSPEQIFWRIDFEGQSRGRRLICMGSAQSSNDVVTVDLELPIDCRVEL